MTKYSIYSVYSIICKPLQRCYIGQTNNVARRRKEHFEALAANNHSNRHLQIAYNIYGKRQFAFKILERSITFKEINEREQYWIKYYNSCVNGFNRNSGAGVPKTPPSNHPLLSIATPPRDLHPELLSLQELTDFKPIKAARWNDFWCYVGKHLVHREDGIIYLNSKNHMCCPDCYRYLKYHRWE